MKNRILISLKEFEQEHKVKILLAVESGSRGWGFSSQDSDYDIRFVFQRETSAYLNLTKPQDSFRWEEGLLDFEGFDIYKFYDLILKSNMSIIDWLFQDVIYLDEFPEKEELRQIVELGFNRQTYISHNYGHCMKNYQKYFKSLKPDEPTAKRYIYCIRALLSAKFCQKYKNLAPLKFDELITYTLPKKKQEEIRVILEIKKNTQEKKKYVNQRWDSWIGSTLNAGVLTTEFKASFTDYYTKLNKHLLGILNHEQSRR